MKNILLICEFFFLFFSSCQNTVTYNEETIIKWDDFEETSLIGKELEFDADVMKPYQLIVYDSILMTVNENTSHICHIFNLTTHRKIGERIKIGHGPNEMIHPFFY